MAAAMSIVGPSQGHGQLAGFGFARVAAGGVDGADLDEDGHDDDQPRADQHHRPPVDL